MPADVFADTSGWANLFLASQPHHDLAVFIYDELVQDGRKLVTTNYVVNELIALLTSPLRIPRPQAIACVEEIARSPHVTFVHVNEQLHSEAWQLLSRRVDKDWSLVDCASCALMEQLVWEASGRCVVISPRDERPIADYSRERASDHGSNKKRCTRDSRH